MDVWCQPAPPCVDSQRSWPLAVDEMQSRWLSTGEAAGVVRKSQRTIRRWAETGRIPREQPAGPGTPWLVSAPAITALAPTTSPLETLPDIWDSLPLLSAAVVLEDSPIEDDVWRHLNLDTFEIHWPLVRRHLRRGTDSEVLVDVAEALYRGTGAVSIEKVRRLSVDRQRRIWLAAQIASGLLKQDHAIREVTRLRR